MNTLSAAENLAAGVWQSGLAQVIGGLVIVGVLIGAVWLGFRLSDRESDTPKPEDQPHRPDTGALPGETSEYRRPAEMPQNDGEHRLMPYHGPCGPRRWRPTAGNRGTPRGSGTASCG
ncbi:hypothetical protein STANM309S_01730 [Streptomyces tanashiensis]